MDRALDPSAGTGSFVLRYLGELAIVFTHFDFDHVIEHLKQDFQFPNDAKAGRRLSLVELEQNPERGLDVLRYCVNKCKEESRSDPHLLQRVHELEMVISVI